MQITVWKILCLVAFLVGCGSNDRSGGNISRTEGSAIDKQPTANDSATTDDETAIISAEAVAKSPKTAITAKGGESEEALYDGFTLEAWRERIKNLDPNDPENTAAVPGLIAIAQDRDAPEISRRQAAITLGRMGLHARQAVPIIIALLDEEGSHQESTRGWALKSLALFGPESKAATPRIIELFQDNRQPHAVRIAAIEALAQIGAANPAAIAALIHSLTEISTEMREYVVDAISLLGVQASAAIPALTRLSQAKDETLRRKSLAALGAMGRRAEIAMPTFLEALAFDDVAAVRDQAASSLSKIGPNAVPMLASLLKDSDPEVRWRVASALGTMGPAARSTTGQLKKLLADESSLVRIETIEALWAITSDSEIVVPPLVNELTSRDRQTRIRAFRLLVALGTKAESAVPRLLELKSDERVYVRQAAEKALERIRRAQ